MYSGCWYNGREGGTGLTKEDCKGDRQTDRMREIEKGSWQTVVGEQSLGKDITRKKRDGGWGGEEESPDTIIRQEPERPKMQNTGETGPKKEEGERTKSRMQNQKEGVAAWASRDLDPAKTLQIRWCRRVDGRR